MGRDCQWTYQFTISEYDQCRPMFNIVSISTSSSQTLHPEVSHTLSHLNTEAWLVSYAASRLRIRWVWRYQQKRSMELRQLGFKMLSKGEKPWVRYGRTRPDSPTPGSSWIVKGITTWTQFQTCHCLLLHLVVTDTSLHLQKQLVNTCSFYLFSLPVLISNDIHVTCVVFRVQDVWENIATETETKATSPVDVGSMGYEGGFGGWKECGMKGPWISFREIFEGLYQFWRSSQYTQKNTQDELILFVLSLFSNVSQNLGLHWTCGPANS